MANAAAGPSFHGWSRLPIELKLLILSHRLTLKRPLNAQTHASHSLRALLPLTLASKTMHDMALEVYYGSNTIVASRTRNIMGSTCWTRPKASVAHWVRKLEVHIDVPGKHSWTTDPLIIALPPIVLPLRTSIFGHDSGADWKYLLKPSELTQSNDDAWRWQLPFCSLHHLKIITFTPQDGNLCQVLLVPIHKREAYRETLLAILRKQLRHSAIDLRARTVETVVQGGMSCHEVWLRYGIMYFSSDEPACEEACRGVLEQIIKEKAEEASNAIGQQDNKGMAMDEVKDDMHPSAERLQCASQ
jgi:hypothetical protein